ILWRAVGGEPQPVQPVCRTLSLSRRDRPGPWGRPGHMRRILLSMVLLVGLSGVAFGQTAPASEIAPGGKLRVGMIAITVLGGVAEPVARFIGQKLGAAVEPVMYPNPEAYLQSFGKGEWDIPRVLAPADKADSTADLWVISLIYVAAPGKEFPDIASVDKAGVKWPFLRRAQQQYSRRI